MNKRKSNQKGYTGNLLGIRRWGHNTVRLNKLKNNEGRLKHEHIKKI